MTPLKVHQPQLGFSLGAMATIPRLHCADELLPAVGGDAAKTNLKAEQLRYAQSRAALRRILVQCAKLNDNVGVLCVSTIAGGLVEPLGPKTDGVEKSNPVRAVFVFVDDSWVSRVALRVDENLQAWEFR